MFYIHPESHFQHSLAAGPVFEFFIMNATNAESTPLLNLFQIEATTFQMPKLWLQKSEALEGIALSFADFVAAILQPGND